MIPISTSKIIDHLKVLVDNEQFDDISQYRNMLINKCNMDDIPAELSLEHRLLLKHPCVQKGSHIIQHLNMLSDNHTMTLVIIANLLKHISHSNIHDLKTKLKISADINIIDINLDIMPEKDSSSYQSWMKSKYYLKMMFNITPQPSSMVPVKSTEIMSRHNRTGLHGFIDVEDAIKKLGEIPLIDCAIATWWLDVDINGKKQHILGTSYPSTNYPGTNPNNPDYTMRWLFSPRYSSEQEKDAVYDYVNSNGGDVALLKSKQYQNLLINLGLITIL